MLSRNDFILSKVCIETVDLFLRWLYTQSSRIRKTSDIWRLLCMKSVILCTASALECQHLVSSSQNNLSKSLSIFDLAPPFHPPATLFPFSCIQWMKTQGQAGCSQPSITLCFECLFIHLISDPTSFAREIEPKKSLYVTRGVARGGYWDVSPPCNF